MPGPVGSTTIPVGGSAISSSQFGIPVATDVTNYLENVWVDYSSTFQWTAATTNPTKGTSIYQARYLWMHPRCVKVIINIRIQSGFSAGSGIYFWSVPFQAAAADGNGAVGTFYLLRSGTASHVGNVTFNTANALQAQRQSDGAPLGATSISGFGGVNDLVRMEIDYEPL